jgi:hypothetical protein
MFLKINVSALSANILKIQADARTAVAGLTDEYPAGFDRVVRPFMHFFPGFWRLENLA